MLRWKLKKSVPFEADETVISYMRQAPREDGVDVVTALARLRIVREYEALAEGVGLYPGRGDELVRWPRLRCWTTASQRCWLAFRAWL